MRKYNVWRIVKAFRWLLSLTCFFQGTLCLMWQNYELWVIHCRRMESGHEGLKMPESPDALLIWQQESSEVDVCESECGCQHRADTKLGTQERTNVTMSWGFKTFSFSNQWHDLWYVTFLPTKCISSGEMKQTLELPVRPAVCRQNRTTSGKKS